MFLFLCSGAGQFSLDRRHWLTNCRDSIYVSGCLQTAVSSPWTEDLRVAVAGKAHDEVNGYIALENIRDWVATAILPAHDHFMFFIG